MLSCIIIGFYNVNAIKTLTAGIILAIDPEVYVGEIPVYKHRGASSALIL